MIDASEFFTSPNLAGAIIGHFFGDYILQNHFLAINKKKSSWVCGLHCFLWALAVVFLGFLPWTALLPLAILHFVIDRWSFVSWWMEFNGQAGFRDKLAPWSSIAVDNTMHLAQVWIVWVFVVGGWL